MLRLRDGDPDVFDEYNDQQRIHTGSAEALRDGLYDAWRAGRRGARRS